MFDTFDGIDLRKCYSGEKNIFDMVNFRISADGSLKKRNGFFGFYPMLGATVTTAWGGTLNGEYVCFYLSGSSLYHLTLPVCMSTYIGNVASYSGKPTFFIYKNSLYLFTSAGFYRLTKSSITPIVGYIPLYGKNWACGKNGEENEPLNVMNGYGRIHYKIPETYSASLWTGKPILSIISVYKNGTLLTTDDYKKDERYPAIIVSGLAPGDELVATYEYDVAEARQKLFGFNHAEVFGGVSSSRVLLWGGADKSKMLASSFVSDTSLAEAQAVFTGGECSPLYFPEGCSFTVGEGRHPVKGVSRHYDRLLIFTEGDTWMANSADCQNERIPVMNINSHVGCSSEGATTVIGNDPVTVWKNGIYRWTSETDELNECNAYCISNEISENLDESFFANAIVLKNAKHNEIWFYDPTTADNVWVYNVSKGSWYRFVGITAVGFFDANDQIGFFNNRGVYIFSEFDFIDKPNNQANIPILTSLSIKTLDFGDRDKKQLAYFGLDGESDGSEVSVSITSDKGTSVNLSFTQSKSYSQLRKRTPPMRFSYLKQIHLSTYNESNISQTIRRLEIGAR